MIKKSMTTSSKPFLLQPVGKDFLWGGTRLRTEFGKKIDLTPLAETWECSVHPDGPSMVISGEWKGKNLAEVLALHPEMLGTHPEPAGELPILIKFIDAKQDLSVQVHPDDEYAKHSENGQSGKTEMWYVMDAEPGAKLVYGFYQDITKEQLRKSLEDGTVGKYLQKVSIQKDDVFFIEAGTVHAIGAGALIAEIQENSNLTYRMFDYNRVDKDGNHRELHKEKALDVAILKGSTAPRQPMRLLKYQNGIAKELLCRCRYFQVDRLLINTELSKEMVSFRTNENSFCVFLCLEGCGVVFMDDGEVLNFFKGDCFFVPANSIGMKFHGKTQMLKVSC